MCVSVLPIDAVQVSVSALVVQWLYIQIDKKRVIDESEGRLWADSKGFHYFETSALTGDGVNDMFQVGHLTRAAQFPIFLKF